MSDAGTTRREVLKKAAYTTPVLITLKANLEFASAGSGLPPSSDRVITGGPNQTYPITSRPVESAPPPHSPDPVNSEPPPSKTPPPVSAQPPSPITPAPISSELPPPDSPVPGHSAPPPADDPATGSPGKRRRRRRLLHRWRSTTG